jgi:hypothetical protein
MANLTITRQRTALYQINVTSAGAAPIDLSGKSLAFSAKVNLSDAAPFISKSSPSGGISITSPAADGIAVLQIDPADTATLPDIQSNSLVWDLKLVDGPNSYPLVAGNLKVLGNVGA